MNVNAQKFQSLYELVCKSLAWRNHRTTLPQLRCAQQLPQRGSRDWLCHSSNRPETATLRAIFIAPTKLRRFTFHHSTCHSETGRGRAIFIAPTKTRKWVHFSIQRTTLPQSRPLGVPAPSGREPGRGVPCNQRKNTLKNSQIHERSFLWIH